MEFKKYLKILKNYFGFILIFTIITCIAACFGSIYKAPIYEGRITLMISPVPKDVGEQPPFYEYDGYYAIQSSQLFANTVSGWLTSPDIIKSIYQEANLDLETKSIEELRERIRTTIKSTQSQNNLVDAVFMAKSNSELKKISDATYNILSQKVEQFNLSTGNKITYRIEKLGEPAVVKIIPNVILNTILGVIAGIILSIILAFLAHYFKYTKI